MGAALARRRDEWEAFLGKDEDLFAFNSVADLVAFVRNESDHDLGDHPPGQRWSRRTPTNSSPPTIGIST